MSESFTSFIDVCGWKWCGFLHQLKPLLDYIAHWEIADSSLAALMGWDVMEVGGGILGHRDLMSSSVLLHSWATKWATTVFVKYSTPVNN